MKLHKSSKARNNNNNVNNNNSNNNSNNNKSNNTIAESERLPAIIRTITLSHIFNNTKNESTTNIVKFNPSTASTTIIVQ